MMREASDLMEKFRGNSPSCSCSTIYDGTFSGKPINGRGITSELLLRKGIKIREEEDL